MRKLLTTMITIAPLLAMADANITFYNHNNNPDKWLLQPNVLDMYKDKDQCIHSVEPADVQNWVYDPNDEHPFKTRVVTSDTWPTCYEEVKYQDWTLWTQRTPSDPGRNSFATVRYMNWYHSGYSKWYTKIVPINTAPWVAVTAKCKVGNTWVNCLSRSTDISDVGVENVNDIKVTFKYDNSGPSR